MSVLVFVELQNGTPNPDSLDLLAAAGRLTDADVIALVIGSGAEDLAGFAAADTVLVVSAPDYGRYRTDLFVDLISEAVARLEPELLLLSNSYVGIDLTAALAARTRWPAVTYCTALERADSTLEAHCLAFGGKLDATVRLELPAVIGVNAGALKSPARAARNEVRALDLTKPKSKIRFVESVEQDTSEVDIRHAEKLVCVGRGIGDQDALPLAEELAAAVGGEIAGSRPVVDSGWLPKSRQVGKSGLKVKPKLYIALGVSGAPEHLEGMGEAEFIVAINADPAAPIFDVAHVGSTCDVAELLPLLTAKIQESAGR